MKRCRLALGVATFVACVGFYTVADAGLLGFFEVDKTPAQKLVDHDAWVAQDASGCLTEALRRYRVQDARSKGVGRETYLAAARESFTRAAISGRITTERGRELMYEEEQTVADVYTYPPSASADTVAHRLMASCMNERLARSRDGRLGDLQFAFRMAQERK